MRSAGAWGPVVFVLLYVLFTVALVPATPMTILAGLIFGFKEGMVVSVIGAVLGADAAFLISRSVLRSRIERWIRKHRALVALDGALARHEVKVQSLLRLSPTLPFFLINYLLGASSVSRRSYLWTTAVFLIPSSAFHVYLGVVGRYAVEKPTGAEIGFHVVGVIIAAISIAYIGHIAKRALKEIESENEPHPVIGLN